MAGGLAIGMGVMIVLTGSAHRAEARDNVVDCLANCSDLEKCSDALVEARKKIDAFNECFAAGELSGGEKECGYLKYMFFAMMTVCFPPSCDEDVKVEKYQSWK